MTLPLCSPCSAFWAMSRRHPSQSTEITIPSTVGIDHLQSLLYALWSHLQITSSGSDRASTETSSSINDVNGFSGTHLAWSPLQYQIDVLMIHGNSMPVWG